MLRVAAFLAAISAAAPCWAADLLPHEGKYVVRLGTSASAPEVGTARQLLGLDCRVWRLERDVMTDIALTGGLRLTSGSELRGVEPREGAAFDYELRRTYNDRVSTITGRISVGKDSSRANLVFPSRPVILELPSDLVLPVSAFAKVIDTLKSGATSFSFLVYDPELTSGALRVEGGVVPADSLRPMPADPVRLPEGPAWPIELAFTRPEGNTRPLFSVLALLHEGGILDRLTINTGLIAASADLVGLSLLPRPTCPTSRFEAYQLTSR
jgi:hypothetical protein